MFSPVSKQKSNGKLSAFPSDLPILNQSAQYSFFPCWKVPIKGLTGRDGARGGHAGTVEGWKEGVEVLS